jgi:hypothetical protein
MSHQGRRTWAEPLGDQGTQLELRGWISDVTLAGPCQADFRFPLPCSAHASEGELKCTHWRHSQSRKR